MSKIADKHGLTNKYRSSKRNVKRGRPRKYLFGPPSRKRKTNKKTSYKWIEEDYSCVPESVDTDTSGCAVPVFLVFLGIVAIMFLFMVVFRCLLPIVIGTMLLVGIDDWCKNAWGLPKGRWSKPVSWLWTVFTILFMIAGFVLVLLVQTKVISFVFLIVTILLYGVISFMILQRKYKEINFERTKER